MPPTHAAVPGHLVRRYGFYHRYNTPIELDLLNQLWLLTSEVQTPLRRDLTMRYHDFIGVDQLGLIVVGQQIKPDQIVLACRVAATDRWCKRCGDEGIPRGTIIRRFVHVPTGWRSTLLEVKVRRYRCPHCGHVWRQNLDQVGAPRAKLSSPAVLWALKAVILDRVSITRIAANLNTSWHTVNNAVLAAGRQLLINNPSRFDGVKVGGLPPFLSYDTEIHKVICSTNAIESLNARFRRSVRARGHFPTKQAALKCLYLTVRSLDPTRRGQVRMDNASQTRIKRARNHFRRPLARRERLLK